MFANSAELYDLFYAWKDYRGEAERVRHLVGERHAAAATLLDSPAGRARTWRTSESGSPLKAST